MQKKTRKLALKKETVRQLTPSAPVAAEGDTAVEDTCVNPTCGSFAD